VPVVGLPPTRANATVDFSLETSYMSLDCSEWEVFGESDARLARYFNLWRCADPFRVGLGSGRVGFDPLQTHPA
jgi:hypothetical protein